jgi:hypothetical protein
MSSSPVYDGFSNPPPTYPLGVPISDKVSIQEIDRRSADRMYKAHHSYLPRGRCGWHYGVYFEDRIVGAISFDNWPSQATIRGYESADIREVSRVCIAHDTPNLASCAMAKAQDQFVTEHCDGIELLVTYVREDYEGSMFAALAGKGWQRDGHSKGHAPGNREKHEIHDWDKERWVCELE